MAPPDPAALPAKVEFVTASPPSAVLRMPPPAPDAARLAVKVEPLTVTTPPLLKIAPPLAPLVFPESVTSLTVTVPAWLKIAPPLPVPALPFSMMRSASVSPAPWSTEITRTESPPLIVTSVEPAPSMVSPAGSLTAGSSAPRSIADEPARAKRIESGPPVALAALIA